MRGSTLLYWLLDPLFQGLMTRGFYVILQKQVLVLEKKVAWLPSRNFIISERLDRL